MPEGQSENLDLIKARLAHESTRHERKRPGKVTNLFLAALFKTATLTGCAPEMVDHSPPPIIVIAPSSPEVSTPEFIVNGKPVSEFPYYPKGDEILVNPPELTGIGQEHYDAVTAATCVVFFIPEFDGELTGKFLSGFVTEGGYVITAKHIIEDKQGNSILGERSKFITVHSSGVVADAGNNIVVDPTGQDIIAIKVDSFAGLSHLPIDPTLPQSGSTVLQGTMHASFGSTYYENFQFGEADVFRGIFGGTQPEDPNKILLRGGLDTTTPINASAPGASGGPLYNPETGAVYAVNSGQLGGVLDGETVRKYLTKRVVRRDNDLIVEEIDPIDVSFSYTPSQEFLDMIHNQ